MARPYIWRELQLGDVASGLAVGLWQAERRGGGRLISAQAASEPGNGTSGGIVEPCFEAVRLPSSDHRLKPLEEMAGRSEAGYRALDDRHCDRVAPW